MNDAYARVLRAWAAQYVPDDPDVVITDVSVSMEPGFRGSDVTPPDDPTLDVTIRYIDYRKSGRNQRGFGGSQDYRDERTVASSLSKLLTELFTIERKSR